MKKVKLNAAASRARKSQGAAPVQPSPSKFQEAIKKWRDGMQLAQAAALAGLKRSKFRRHAIAECGGKAGFEAARAQGAGGSGRGANLRKGVARPRVDDSQLKYLKRGKGWTVRRVWIPKIVKIKVNDENVNVLWRECAALVFVSPKGNEYVRAENGEKADALVRGMHSLPDTRLKRYADSKLADKVSAHVARAERIATNAERITERDTERRVARRKARKAKAGRR